MSLNELLVDFGGVAGVGFFVMEGLRAWARKGAQNFPALLLIDGWVSALLAFVVMLGLAYLYQFALKQGALTPEVKLLVIAFVGWVSSAGVKAIVHRFAPIA